MFNLVSFFIVIFGGINWFCIGLFQFDIIAGIFGSQAHFVSRFFYCIIGICAIYSIIALPIKKGRIYEPKNKQQQELQEDSDNNTEDDEQVSEKENDTESEEKSNDAKSKPKSNKKKKVTLTIDNAEIKTK